MRFEALFQTLSILVIGTSEKPRVAIWGIIGSDGSTHGASAGSRG
jgi:hypothetical protein